MKGYFGYLIPFIWINMLVLSLDAWGQDCVSQGDPIVHIDFGVGTPDFGMGTTTYRPNQGGALSDGEYKIASNIRQGRGEWHDLGDNSSDADGMMLVVNASHAPGEFYRTRVDGLCANTQFVFSAAIANANRPSNCAELVRPRVRFVIEDLAGNVVAEYSTGNIEPTQQPYWHPFSFSFNTGNQHSFYLVLINDNPGGCGNDLAIDDIRFAPCGPQVELLSTAGLIVQDTLYYCPQQVDAIVLEGNLPAGEGDTFVYQWQTRLSDGTWLDMEGENSLTLSVDRVSGTSFRLAVAAEQASMDIQGCRFTSPPVTLRPATDARDFVTDTVPPMALCERSEFRLRPVAPLPVHYGEVAGIRWDRYLNGVWHEVSRDEEYSASTDVVGGFRYRHVAELVCGGEIVTAVYSVAVLEAVVASLALASRSACLDDGPITLVGGSLSTSSAEFVGEYSGPGVVDGIFYPSVAGPGRHVINYGVDGYACSQLAQDTIEVYGQPVIQPLATIRIRRGGYVTLNPVTDGVFFEWSGGPGLNAYDVPNPIASPSETTTYQLTVRSVQGCVSSETVTVIVLPDLAIPNTFTPNGDGINDQWEVKGLESYTSASVQVFNRWGNRVFTSDGSQPWDGRYQGDELPAGTYYYIITADQLYERISGAVSILR